MLKDMPGTRVFQEDSYYGPWVPRGGDNLISRIQLLEWDAATNTVLTVTFFTKNTDEPGDPGSAIAGKSIVITISGGSVNGSIHGELIVSTTAPFGLKELVRCKYAVTAGGSGDWLLIRSFDHVFFDTAKG